MRLFLPHLFFSKVEDFDLWRFLCMQGPSLLMKLESIITIKDVIELFFST